MKARAVRCSGFFFLRGVSLVHWSPNNGNKYEKPRAGVVKFGVVPLARGMRGTRTAEVAGGIRQFHLPSGMGGQDHASDLEAKTLNVPLTQRNGGTRPQDAQCDELAGSPRASTGECRAADPRPGGRPTGRWAYGEKRAAGSSPSPAMISSQARLGMASVVSTHTRGSSVVWARLRNAASIDASVLILSATLSGVSPRRSRSAIRVKRTVASHSRNTT